MNYNYFKKEIAALQKEFAVSNEIAQTVCFRIHDGVKTFSMCLCQRKYKIFFCKSSLPFYFYFFSTTPLFVLII